MLTAELDEFIVRMPKVELHLHLEGSMTPQTLLDLAQQNNFDLPAHDIAGVEQLFHYHHFSEFITLFMQMAQVIVRGEDFARLAYELGSDLATQNVLYAEVMISPMQHIRRGMDLYEAISGAAAGFAQVARETGTQIRIALDHGRQYGPDLGWQVLDVARRAQPLGVVGWSIGGNEIGYPPEPFADLFAAAREAGLGLMAHAGEVVGPVSVWGAINELGVQRIGHGVRSVEDPALMTALIERGIILDVCPSSNLRTGAVTNWESHPLRQLYDAGVTVTLNSDDPSFFHTTITEEYRRAVQHFGFTIDDLIHLVQNAVDASFLPVLERQILSSRIAQEMTMLRREIGV